MEKLERMHWLYGLDKGHSCKECSCLEQVHSGGQSAYKCKVYGMEAGPATDWSGDWEACGMRNRSYAGVSIQNLQKQ